MIVYIRFRFGPDIRVFKKNYCCICGRKLNRKFTLLKKIHNGGVYYRLTNSYICKECNYEILYSSQKKIKKLQEKKYDVILDNGKKLIGENKIEVYFDKKHNMQIKWPHK